MVKKRAYVVGRKPAGHIHGATLRDRVKDLIKRELVLPVKLGIFGSCLYVNSLLSKTPEPGSCREECITSEKRKSKLVESISVKSQKLMIGKEAKDAYIKREGTKDVMSIEFKDGSSIKVTLKAGSIRRMYIQEGEKTREINQEEAIEFLKKSVVSGFGRVPGHERREAPEKIDKVVFQSSNGECLVLDVESGAIERVDYHTPNEYNN